MDALLLPGNNHRQLGASRLTTSTTPASTVDEDDLSRNITIILENLLKDYDSSHHPGYNSGSFSLHFIPISITFNQFQSVSISFNDCALLYSQFKSSINNNYGNGIRPGFIASYLTWGSGVQRRSIGWIQATIQLKSNLTSDDVRNVTLTKLTRPWIPVWDPSIHPWTDGWVDWQQFIIVSFDLFPASLINGCCPLDTVKLNRCNVWRLHSENNWHRFERSRDGWQIETSPITSQKEG